MSANVLLRPEMEIPRGLHKIRVFGEPLPAAKDEVVRTKDSQGRFKTTLMKQDYRIRTDPFSGQKVKYDRGYKQRWIETVRLAVFRYMLEHKLRPFPKNHPIAMGTLFFVTQAASNKLILPAQAPDEDNYDYAIKNAVKRTIKRRGRPGPYPDGILYYEDDQICWRLWPGGQIWATDRLPPGVLISVANLEDVHDLMGEYDPY